MFDAARGTVTVATREAVSGEPLGSLPRPVRQGYQFEGWYLGSTRVDGAYVPQTDEDICLVARWTKRTGGSKKATGGLRRQTVAIAVLSAVAVLLLATLFAVNYLASIYPVVDEYYAADGTPMTEKYYLRKNNGLYGMYRKDGTLLPVNSDGFYIADSQNQYEVNAETGECSLFAAVDYDASLGESLQVNVNRVLMFGQIQQSDIYSIDVTNEYGSYRFYRDENGDFQIEGYEDTLIDYNGELFASLCVSCGYTLSKQKLDLTADAAPRLPDGSVDLSAYGLTDRYDEEGNLISPAVYTVRRARFEGKKCYPSDEVYTVRIGDMTPSKDGYYAMLEGRNAVYVLDPMLEDATLQSLETLVTPRVSYPFDNMLSGAMVMDFELIRFDDFLGTENLADGNPHPIVMFSYADLESRVNTMFTTTPYVSDLELMDGYAINDEMVTDTMMCFYEMEILRCVEIGITNEKMIEYGLDKNVWWIAYDSIVDSSAEEKSYIRNKMVVGPKNENGNYYVASYLYDMIVEVDPYYFAFLECEEKDWYEQYFISQNIAYVDSMRFEINGKTYDFTMDNSFSYSYYLADDGTPTLVKFSNGTLYDTGNGQYRFKPADSQNAYPVYFIDFENGKFGLDKNGETVYYVGDKTLMIEADASNLFVSCEQYLGSNEKDPHRLDYTVRYDYINDVGEERTTYISAVDNFRRFWIQDWYWLSLEGDVDRDAFERNTGMTVEEYIAQGDSACYAKITVHVEDMAKYLNYYTYTDENGKTVKLYTENNERDLVFRFYRYSERRAMVTVEVVKSYDANGDPISDPTNALGRFYVQSSYLDMMGEDLEKVVKGERVERDER